MSSWRTFPPKTFSPVPDPPPPGSPKSRRIPDKKALKSAPSRVRLDGTFNAGVGGNRISGGFHGPDHRESVGVMEQLGIVGTFGARRREAE